MKFGPLTYSKLDWMFASPTKPVPAHHRTHQLTVMLQGLEAIEKAQAPTPNDWRVVSDAVNLMETLVAMGAIEDSSGLLLDAVEAMAKAGCRYLDGGQIRLDGPGIQAVRAVLEDYAAVLEAVPHRTIIECHRKTEVRIREVLNGKKQPHDVEVISL